VKCTRAIGAYYYLSYTKLIATFNWIHLHVSPSSMIIFQVSQASRMDPINHNQADCAGLHVIVPRVMTRAVILLSRASFCHVFFHIAVLRLPPTCVIVLPVTLPRNVCIRSAVLVKVSCLQSRTTSILDSLCFGVSYASTDNLAESMPREGRQADQDMIQCLQLAFVSTLHSGSKQIKSLVDKNNNHTDNL
jgi:hypothetical protein